MLYDMGITPTHRTLAGPLKVSYTEPVEQRNIFPVNATSSHWNYCENVSISDD